MIRSHCYMYATILTESVRVYAGLRSLGIFLEFRNRELESEPESVHVKIGVPTPDKFYECYQEFGLNK